MDISKDYYDNLINLTWGYYAFRRNNFIEKILKSNIDYDKFEAEDQTIELNKNMIIQTESDLENMVKEVVKSSSTLEEIYESICSNIDLLFKYLYTVLNKYIID